MRPRLLIAGAGGFGGAVAEAAAAMGIYELVGFADDRWPTLERIPAGPVIGSLGELNALRGQADAVAVAIGNGAVRERVFLAAQAAGFLLPAIVHPRAYVAHGATLGAGVLVLAGACIGTGSRLADGALVNTGAMLDHDCEVGAFAHIGVAASMGGGTRLAPGERLPQGAVLAFNA